MSAVDVAVMVYTSPFARPTVDTANDMQPYACVLSRFRGLKLGVGHGGYPRARQVIETTRHQPRLYNCQQIYSFWPGGQHYMHNIERLQAQFIFGTSYPFSSMAEPVNDTPRLPLGAPTMVKYLWGNGARLLKLSGSA
jgi:predicted TIM-barrel fold metal-dependent hydrolase